MKQVIFILLVISLISTPVWSEDGMQAGVATIDITPPVGVPLAGYGGGKRRLIIPDFDPNNYHTFLAPSEGVMDRLIAKAMVLESNGKKIAILKADTIGVSQDILNDVAKKIQPVTGIDRDHLTLTGTHTHSGPGAVIKSPFWAVAAVDVLDSRVYNKLVEQLSELIIAADRNRQPARLGITTTLSYDLTKNRRGNPGVKDPTIALFKLEKLDGTPLAVLFNFAIHGTCYGADNMHFSTDVMGVAESRIESVMQKKKTPLVAMFVNGSEGDVAPAHSHSKGAKAVGYGLGEKVLQTLPALTTRTDLDIAVANKEIKFDKAIFRVKVSRAKQNEQIDCWGVFQYLQKFTPADDEHLKIDISGLVPMKFRIQAIRLGDTVIACVPGEPITNIGTAIKQAGEAAGFNQTFIFGLANGHMGYVTDKENYDQGHYEAMLTLYGRDQGEVLVDTFSELFQQLAKDKE